MPLLAQLLASLFGATTALLLKLLSARLALRVGGVLAVAALGTALVVAFNLFVTPLVGGLFSTQYGQLLGLVFPPISGTILTGLLVFWAACLVYRLQVRAIRSISEA
jgi:hypothetical protein